MATTATATSRNGGMCTPLWWDPCTSMASAWPPSTSFRAPTVPQPGATVASVWVTKRRETSGGHEIVAAARENDQGPGPEGPMWPPVGWRPMSTDLHALLGD